MTAAKKSSNPEEIRAAEQADLDRQYGNIGISAVAAALRYGGDAKNPAYAPAEGTPDERFEAAA